MIEKLQEGEFRESVISNKVNELIDAFNDHRHTVVRCDDDSSYNVTSVPVEEK